MTLKNYSQLLSKATLVIFAFLTLLACEVTDRNQIPMPDPEKPYELKHDTKLVTIEFAPHSSKLSAEENKRFVSALKPFGTGKVSIHITIPNKGSPLGKKRIKHIIKTALEAGVKAKQIHRSNHLASATGSSVQIQLDIYRVIAPLCPNWSSTYGQGYDRGNTSNFGCANANNFLLMIDDPIILFKGEKALSRDAARDSLSIADQRAGKDKGKWLKVETSPSGSTTSNNYSGSPAGAASPGSGGTQ